MPLIYTQLAVNITVIIIKITFAMEVMYYPEFVFLFVW